MPLPADRPPLRRARVRAAVLAIVCAGVTAAAAPAGAIVPGTVPETKASQAKPSATAPDLVLQGRGHGHGVGMTHDGALALGRQGRSAAQILATFYPGTTLGTATTTLRVLVHDAASAARLTVRLPAGGTLRPERGPVQGLPLRLAPGAAVDLTSDGARVTAASGRGTVTAPRGLLLLPDTVAALPDGSTHRGVLQVMTAAGRLRAIAHLDVEDYLRGMGEVRDSSWPDAALRAQVVAARSYAIHAVRYAPRDPDFDVYADDRSQVYLGAHAEYAAMDRAVDATRSEVLRYDGAIANAVYSTNGGGVTATAVEGFGPSRLRFPYLTTVRYPTPDPLPWTYRQPLREVARRLDYPGSITSFAVTAVGGSGRATAVRVTGTRGPRDFSGLAVAERLGLRSTLFAVVRPAPAAKTAAVPRTGAAPRIALGVVGAPTGARTLSPAAASRDRAADRRTASGLAWLLIAAAATGLVRQGAVDSPRRRALTGGG